MFSPDGSKFSYCAKKGKNWMMIIDGVEQPSNKGAPYVSYFSPNDKDVYYIGQDGSALYYFKNNLNMGKIPGTGTSDIVFSANGTYYAYIYDNRLFINGNKGDQYDKIFKPNFITENEISYYAEKDGKLNFIVEKID
jgi:hypothetical protein